MNTTGIIRASRSSFVKRVRDKGTRSDRCVQLLVSSTLGFIGFSQALVKIITSHFTTEICLKKKLEKRSEVAVAFAVCLGGISEMHASW